MIRLAVRWLNSPDSNRPYYHEIRIEIDSILAKVGAEGLWKYIKHKVEELAPLDLRKSIDMPPNQGLYDKEIAGFFSFLDEYTDDITRDARKKIEDNLNKATELYVAEAKEEEINDDLSHKVAIDEGIRLLSLKLPELIEALKELRKKKKE
jgi:hypothetical protein